MVEVQAKQGDICEYQKDIAKISILPPASLLEPHPFQFLGDLGIDECHFAHRELLDMSTQPRHAPELGAVALPYGFT